MKMKSSDLLFSVAAMMQGSIFMINTLMRLRGGWIMFMIALVVAIPLVLIYSKVNVFECGEKLFSWLYIIFFVLVSSYYIDLISAFVKSYVLEETPKVLFVILFIVFCIYAVSGGPKRIMQTGIIFFVVAIISDIINIFLLRDTMQLQNFLPFVTERPLNFIRGIFAGAMILLADTVIFMCFKKETEKSGLMWGYIIGGIMLLGVVVRTIATLGVTSNIFAWPAHEALRLMNSKNAVSRIETSSVFALVAFVFFKVSIILSGVAEGFEKVTGFKNKTGTLLVCGMIVAVSVWALSGLKFKTIDFLTMWGWVIILPFLTVFPVFLWAKNNKLKKIKKSVDK